MMLMSISSIIYADQQDCKTPVLVKGMVILQKNCVYHQKLLIKSSDTTLNCNGALIDGQRMLEHAISIVGDARTFPINNVKILNCRIENFKGSGVRIYLSNAPRVEDWKKYFTLAPQNILLDGLSIKNVGAAGLHVFNHVNHVTLQNSMVERSRMAVYFGYHTRDNSVLNNIFIGNGLDLDRKNPRETIAIDSSANNIISGNYFQHDIRGGVFLYTNCGEFSDGGSMNKSRIQHSDFNQITSNHFIDMPVGVWIAARQSKNMKKADCGDVPMDTDHKFYQDFANSNQVAKNYFCRTPVAVRVEGDFNVIEKNKIEGLNAESIQLPVSQREKYLGKPSVGNTIDGNLSNDQCSSIIKE
jgi:hypothetical protein